MLIFPGSSFSSFLGGHFVRCFSSAYWAIRDFDGNIIIPAKYLEIRNTDKPLLAVRIGENDNYKEGILIRDGIEVVPAEYKYILFYNDYIVCCREGHCEMLRYKSI